MKNWIQPRKVSLIQTDCSRVPSERHKSNDIFEWNQCLVLSYSVFSIVSKYIYVVRKRKIYIVFMQFSSWTESIYIYICARVCVITHCVCVHVICMEFFCTFPLYHISNLTWTCIRKFRVHINVSERKSLFWKNDLRLINSVIYLIWLNKWVTKLLNSRIYTVNQAARKFYN